VSILFRIVDNKYMFFYCYPVEAELGIFNISDFNQT